MEDPHGIRRTAHSMPWKVRVPIRPLHFALILPHTHPCVLCVIGVLYAVP